MDLKKAAAEEALKYIKAGMTIGLGAGSTIAHLARLLKEKYEADMPLHFCTSSFSTASLLKELQLEVISINDVESIDIYFDGCDEVDLNLNALKSGGGIHTVEKLYARQAKVFIILGDQQKLVQKFTGKIPIVAEVIPAASSYVFKEVKKISSPQKIEWQMSNKSDGPVITASGNYLLEIYFDSWPDLATLNSQLKMLTGVIEISLFYKLVHKAIIATSAGSTIIERPL